MGGDLTQGEVKGNEIACLFHDWRTGRRQFLRFGPLGAPGRLNPTLVACFSTMATVGSRPPGKISVMRNFPAIDQDHLLRAGYTHSMPQRGSDTGDFGD
jgi:hypothetical protein